MRCKINCVLAAVAMLAAQGGEAGTLAADSNPLTLNTLVALEAAQEALAGLVLAGGPASATTLGGQWTGTVDAAGWSLDFSGQWGPQTVSLHQTGLLDVANDRSTWSFAGAIGSEGFDGEGRIDFDPRWWSLLLKGVVRVVVYGAQSVVDGGAATHLVSQGVVWVADKIVEHYDPEESTVTPPPPRPTTPPTRSTSRVSSRLAMRDSGYRFDQAGTLTDGSSLSFSTQVSAVPEPSSVLHLLAGMGCLAVAARHRRGRGTRIPAATTDRQAG